MDARKKIEDAKQVLRDAGFYVDDLWSIHDVSDGTMEERMRVLHEVLSSDYIHGEIIEAIEMKL